MVIELKIGLLASAMMAAATPLAALECDIALKELNQAVSQGGLSVASEAILRFKSDEECNPTTQSAALRQTSAQVAQHAQGALGQGDLDVAENWLDQAPALHWLVQVSRADIAAKQDQRAEAASLYNAALDTIMDVELTPEQDQLTAIAGRVAQLAQENTMLAGTLDGSVKRGGVASGVYKALTRGIVFESDTATTKAAEPASDYGSQIVQKVFLPIKFDFDADDLDAQGQIEARRLAQYIIAQNIAKLKLVGHTDSNGSEAYNLDLSERRAVKLALFLKQEGVTAEIFTVGKGESEPPALSDASVYNQDQRNAISRRVEMSLVY